MTNLPHSISTYLLEGEFTATEVMILRQMLDQDSVTLRQLASKTGKSTGVLDQAMKKLMEKKIVAKEEINDTQKFTIMSLESILHWMEEDTRERRESLLRRHQNFESFIRTLKIDKSRPEMQHFEGEEGIRQAYRKLLELGSEMLQYFPVTTKSEEDPLRDFRVELFRERHKRGIFSRIISHDTPLGRRFQSRDAFEYRQTLLLSYEECPFDFEKIIIGNTVACFNLAEQRACFIAYPELASVERALFEKIWHDPKQAAAAVDQPAPVPASSYEHVPDPPAKPIVPLRTRTLSTVREFFLSRKSLAMMGIFAVIAGGLTYGMFRYTQQQTLDRMRERAVAIARTGSDEFSPDDLNQLHVEADWQKPQWAKVVNQLKRIRENNSEIMFVYMLRKSAADPSKIEFIADSHSINPFVNSDQDSTNDVDLNHDGKIDQADYLQWPGQPYPSAPATTFEAFKGPVGSSTLYTDQWGSALSGYAPIQDGSGKTIAVLAVDIRASQFNELMSRSFAPFLVFACIFVVFILIRLSAFNKSLFQEIFELLKIKQFLLSIAVCSVVALLLTIGMYFYTLNIVKTDAAIYLMNVATKSAPDIDPNDVNSVHVLRDMKTDAYQRLYKKLNEIRDDNDNIKFVDIMRPSGDELFEWVCDADTNYNIPVTDLNADGVIDDQDSMVPPGMQYVPNYEENVFEDGLHHPAYSTYGVDQWGVYVSGSAPIYDKNHKALAALVIDRNIGPLEESVKRKFQPAIWFLVFLILLITARLSYMLFLPSKKS